MATASQRERLRQEAREEILGAARQLYLAGEGFSMRQLAGRVGCSPAALYLHFKNKSELLQELMQRSFAILFEGGGVVEDRPGEDPVERIRRGMRGYVQTGLARPDEYRLAFLTPLPEMRRGHEPNRAFAGLRGRARRCLETGRFAPRDAAADIDANADLIAQALWAAVHGVTSLLILRPDFPWVRREALIEQVITGAIAGLLR